jgi:hypothetical protein
MGEKIKAYRYWWESQREIDHWVANIKLDLGEVVWVLDWIGLAESRDQWRALVNTVLICSQEL